MAAILASAAWRAPGWAAIVCSPLACLPDTGVVLKLLIALTVAGKHAPPQIAPATYLQSTGRLDVLRVANFVSRGFAMRKAIAVFGLALLSLLASYAIVSIWPHDSPRDAVQDDEASKISP
jgi:hypothetical protein